MLTSNIAICKARVFWKLWTVQTVTRSVLRAAQFIAFLEGLEEETRYLIKAASFAVWAACCRAVREPRPPLGLSLAECSDNLFPWRDPFVLLKPGSLLLQVLAVLSCSLP